MDGFEAGGLEGELHGALLEVFGVHSVEKERNGNIVIKIDPDRVPGDQEKTEGKEPSNRRKKELEIRAIISRGKFRPIVLSYRFEYARPM